MDATDIEQALRISPLFYDAVLDPARWPTALAALAETFDAAFAQANFVHLAEGRLLTGYFSDPDSPVPAAYRAYEDRLVHDPRNKALYTHIARPVLRRDLVDDATWYGSDIYRELFEPTGFDDTLAIAFLEGAAGLSAAFGLVRATGAPAFARADAERLALYVPHLRRAAQLMTHRLIRDTGEAALRAVFEGIEMATVVTDRHARVIFANRAARDLIAGARAIRQPQGRLAAADPAAERALRGAIHAAATRPREAARAHVALPSAAGGVALLATVSPLRDGALGLSDAPEGDLLPRWATVFLADARATYETPHEALTRLYGLTDAEAAVAAALASGESPRRIADRTERSYETVRWLLKHAMAKMGVHRQAELVRLVLAAGNRIDR